MSFKTIKIRTMYANNIKLLYVSGVLLFLSNLFCYAGPPFDTDDPEPVKYKHWEYYISSINMFKSHNITGTSPHFEINYGLVPNVQIHLLMPLNYNYIQNNGIKFGYANTELGVKYRFIQESDKNPQIGVFPIIEVPTIRNETFSNGRTQIYLPIWLQKSWGKLTTYGGTGYWINPGTNNKNWFFSGLEIQYDFSTLITLGGEVYHHSADAIDTKSVTAFNVGGNINFTKKFHFIYSFGHSLINDNFFTSYIGVLWTI